MFFNHFIPLAYTSFVSSVIFFWIYRLYSDSDINNYLLYKYSFGGWFGLTDFTYLHVCRPNIWSPPQICCISTLCYIYYIVICSSVCGGMIWTTVSADNEKMKQSSFYPVDQKTKYASGQRYSASGAIKLFLQIGRLHVLRSGTVPKQVEPLYLKARNVSKVWTVCAHFCKKNVSKGEEGSVWNWDVFLILHVSSLTCTNSWLFHTCAVSFTCQRWKCTAEVLKVLPWRKMMLCYSSSHDRALCLSSAAFLRRVCSCGANKLLQYHCSTCATVHMYYSQND